MSALSHPSVNLREHGSAFTITALAALFGAALMSANAALASAMTGSGAADAIAQVRTALDIIAWVFLGIALFVGAVATVNTFGTIIAGRAKRLALLRLLGASARSLRRQSLAEGAVVGVLGALIGTLAGTAIVQALLAAGHRWWAVPDFVEAPWFSTDFIAPAVAAALVTILASWIGSRRVVDIAPVQAFGSARAATESLTDGRRRPPIAAIILTVLGIALIVPGIAVGLSSPMGLLLAFPGGVLTGAAFVVASDRILPALLRLGGSWGRGAPALLAARSAVRNPRRSSRATLGIVIGVILITMFTVGGFTYRTAMLNYMSQFEGDVSAEMLQQVSDALLLPIAIVVGLIAFSVLISVIGLIDSLTLSTIQRRTEIGLLRALGLGRSQVRTMVLAESLRMTVVAVVVGVVLGIVYGWIGSLSLMGSFMKDYGWWPTVPWELPLAAAVGAMLVTGFATLSASRRAVDVAPVEALADE